MVRGKTNPAAVLASAQPCLCAVDVVVLTIQDSQLKVLLTPSGTSGQGYKLPGCFLGPDETLEQAAARALRQETGWATEIPALLALATYSQPDRDPRARVVTHAFVTAHPGLSGRDITGHRKVHWLSAEDATAGGQLVLDHGQILADAIEHVRRRIENTSQAVAFCGTEFTVTELRHVYETIWGCVLDIPNFYRKMKTYLKPADKTSRSGGRPAALFTWSGPPTLNPPIQRPGTDV